VPCSLSEWLTDKFEYIAAAKTQNARRILQYQRQIKHWLDDEEALAAQQAAAVPGPRSAAATGKPAQSRRQSTRPSISIPPTPSGAATPVPTCPSAGPTPTAASAPNDDPQLDPLLSVQNDMPAPINPAELEALLSAPPLLYGASHAAPPALGGPPQRKFCDNCGYWGEIKCLKCGARVCGLECKDAHEATRCLKWA
jgi:zinc finger HIT domain-containing protein 1